MDRHAFDAGAALAFLDEIATTLGTLAPLSIEAAWDAAWIVCMTRDPRHEILAQAELDGVVAEVGLLSAISVLARTDVPAVRGWQRRPGSP